MKNTVKFSLDPCSILFTIHLAVFESAVLTLLKLQIKYQAYVIECELKNLLECIEPMDPEVVVEDKQFSVVLLGIRISNGNASVSAYYILQLLNDFFCIA